MKKQKKNKNKKVKQQKKKTNKKSVKRMVSLKEKLKAIYNSVNLNTTCEGRCECCKVAMPQMNYCEFTQLVNEVWDKEPEQAKKQMIKTSVRYFFYNDFEKFEMKTLIKPCQLLSMDGKCRYYSSRPLSCRMYGLWPDDLYEKRVDKFEKAYEGLLKREEIPLNKQCPYVKRVDDEEPLTEEIIEDMFAKLDKLDAQMQKFTPAQLENRENYRTFHDWLLWSVLGEDRLVMLSTYALSADPELIEEFIEELSKEISKISINSIPNLKVLRENNGNPS